MSVWGKWRHSIGKRRGYSGARPDVVALVPTYAANVLDVGCGAGFSAQLIRERAPQARVVGVEPDSELALQARQHVDILIEGSIDRPEVLSRIRELGPFDVVLCADVLEHLVDPERALQSLPPCLAEGGSVITSIPNVRHVSTFFSLGVQGTWPTRDRGIHDRTHLRFFARRDILALGHRAGLRLCEERRNLRLIESSSWSMVPAKLLDFWPFRAFLTFQYLHRWSR